MEESIVIQLYQFIANYTAYRHLYRHLYGHLKQSPIYIHKSIISFFIFLPEEGGDVTYLAMSISV